MKLSRYIDMCQQPDDTTCGPTSLHAVYSYLNHQVDLHQVIDSVKFLEDGGTLAVMLGMDAIRRGFKATVYSYNLKLLDPTWDSISREELEKKLEDQLKYKHGKRFAEETRAFQDFLRLGGEIKFRDLTPRLLKHYFDQDIPILAGLSATYLYNSMREYTNRRNTSVFHDLKGEPMGHFVVLCGMLGKVVYVADPYSGNPLSDGHYYEVDVLRLINAIMLGIATYDANLLIVTP